MNVFSNALALLLVLPLTAAHAQAVDISPDEARQIASETVMESAQLDLRTRLDDTLCADGSGGLAGLASAEGSSDQLQTDKKYELFTLSERGASVTWTLQAICFKAYKN